MDFSAPLSQKEAVAKAVEAIKGHHCLRFSGPCGSGKTTLCKKILANENLVEDLREGRAFMLTSQRPVADDLSLEIAQGQPYLRDPRPVKTSNALAFWILKRTNPNVRLLDVTSQTKLITEVIKSHIDHVENDDDCRVCNELREYINFVDNDSGTGQTTYELFKKIFLQVGFITRLREAFARFDELGIGLEKGALQPYEQSLRSYEGADELGRGRLSWNLVQSLRREYADKVRNSEDYGDNFFDNSSMLNAAALKVKEENGDLPAVVIVDDCQDLNLAAYALLKEMHNRNVPIIFVGNDDESVQGYKGAMPDILSILEKGKDFNCASYSLSGKEGIDALSKSKFLRGITNNIGSWFIKDVPIPDRPGKPDGEASDEDEKCFEYRKLDSEEEQLDFLTHEISDYMLESKGKEGGKDYSPHWRDLAVVSNENAFLHKIGERLKASRIPFKYTSVNEEPIKNSLVVQAMLSFMKLAYYASLGENAFKQTGSEEVFSLIKNIINSPLFQIEDKNSATDFEISSRIFTAILNVLNHGEDEEKTAFTGFKSWEEWNGEEDKDLNTFFLFLLVNPEYRKEMLGRSEKETVGEDSSTRDRKKDYLSELKSHTTSLAHLFTSIDKAKCSVGDIPQLFWNLWDEPLWIKKDNEVSGEEGQIWEGKSRPELWQHLALESGEISSNINEWLDQLIRLQHLAQIGPDDETVPEFIQRVSGASIDSDSLAHVAPKDEAVTLSSPVGVESKRFNKVWIPDAQEEVWNKSPMEGLFFTRLLEAVVTNEKVGEVSPDNVPKEKNIQDRFSEEESYSNLRSLLVASSRSNGKTVFLAVEDEEHTPLFRLSALEGAKEKDEGLVSKDLSSDERKDEDVDFKDRILKDLELRSSSLSGMSDYCRAVLAKAIKVGDEKRAKDAACALKLLSTQIESANPASWSFMQKPDAREFIQTGHVTISLSPSRVDNLWSTPVNSILQDSRYVGPTKSGSKAQFGTAIHACAQWATEQGLDQLKGICLANCQMSVKEEIDEVKDKLMGKFEEEEDANMDWSPLDRVIYRRRADKAMENLATYFVNTFRPSKTKCPLPSMPDLVKAVPEKWINSTFTLKNILDLVRGTSEFQGIDISESDLIEALETLGDFEGLNEVKDKTISISGQIDRFEERKGGFNYVIDYKTGKSYCDKFKDFSDLQLLCYQLLLYFPGETKNSGDAEKIPWGGKVFADKSMLFSIEEEPYPASASDKNDTTYMCGAKGNRHSTCERYFQPCIFDKKSGLNDGLLSECQRKIGREKSPLIKRKEIPVSSNPILQVLKRLTPEDEKQECINLLPWVFCMLSKFFYVVRYVDSAHFELREEDTAYKDNEELDRIKETMTIYGLGR